MNPPSSHTENPQKIIITAAYYLALITLGLTVGAIGPVLPTLARHTGTALDGVSIIFVASSLGYLLGTWIGGRAFDRIRGHQLMAAVLFMTSVVLFFLPISSTLWVLAMVMALLGFFQGPVDVGANTLLIWLHGSKVGPFMNAMHFFFGFGAFVAPIVVAQVIRLSGDIHWVYWSFAIINIPIALWIWALPSPEVRTQASVASEPRVHALSSILVLLVVLFFLYVGLESGYGNWIYSYATALKLADATLAAYLTSTFWGAFTLFRLVGVWVSTRISPQNIIIGDFAGAGIALGLVLFMPTSQIALWAGTIILGASIASIFPTMLTLAEQRLHLTGSITGWFFVGASLGHMILPWIIGQFFEPLGAGSMMVFLLINLICFVLIFTLLLLKSKKTPDRED
jgi:FHS family Na+ dependent glucose MFS transporter 1